MGVYSQIEGLRSKEWQKGEWTYINKLVWGKPEINKIVDVLETDWFAGNSKFNTEFEDRIKKFSGFNHFQTTNSGSAGLEIAVQTLIQSGVWKAGDKILHPICTFPTSITSAIMAGLVPVYLDVDDGTCVIDDEKLEIAFKSHPDIKGAIIPLLLGNVPNLDKLREYLGDRVLILDSCDVMGSKWEEKEASSFGDFGAYSFYGSHHISTFGVGGGIGTHNSDWARKIKSITFWGRDFSTDNLSQLESFLKRYSYESFGLDAQMTAVQAAFGLAQIDKLDQYLADREFLFHKLTNIFKRYQEWFTLPTRTSDKADISWFCYPLTLKHNAPFTREFMVKHFLDNKVEIRPVMAGNILKYQPFQNTGHYVVGETPNADRIFKYGFFIPNCSMGKEQMNNYLEVIQEFLRKYE